MRRPFLLLVVLVLVALWGLRLRYGGGEPFPDRTTAPLLPASALQVVANLPWPPGNIAVSPRGRVFFTYHPEASPPTQVLELVDGKPVPYPPKLPAHLAFQSVLSIRIDRQQRLWVLDNAHHGFGEPRLLAFDLADGRVVYRHDFPRSIAGWGSHLNDFQVSPDGERIYIADASIFAKTPAIIVHQVGTDRSRRLLEGDESVVSDRYVPVVQGREMLLFGVFAIRPGVDSIALDRSGEWLYFAPVMDNWLYRARTADLDDPALSGGELARRVERFAPKTPSDGIATDVAGNVYLTDPDQSAIVQVTARGELRTLLRTDALRWPDGLGFGPDGWLYVTCSALHQVILKPRSSIRARAPYQIYRFQPGVPGIPGH